MLEDIGFYTLSDSRAASASETSTLQRCELILTDRCNFRCPYCRGMREDCRGDMSPAMAGHVLDLWIADGLVNVRFSGGEPTLHGSLVELAQQCADGGVERIALSTNGSARPALYDRLLVAGVNDISVSLDACCSADIKAMSGGAAEGEQLLDTIRYLSARCYVTVGIVVTGANVAHLRDTVSLAVELGVADIRIIPAAQDGARLRAELLLSDALVSRYPILGYRLGNLRAGKPARGLSSGDPKRCPLVLDDMAVAGQWHFPCIIYLREGGEPIGMVGSSMRHERARWAAEHDSFADPLCKRNCLDVCVDYNRTWMALHAHQEANRKKRLDTRVPGGYNPRVTWAEARE